MTLWRCYEGPDNLGVLMIRCSLFEMQSVNTLLPPVLVTAIAQLNIALDKQHGLL